MFWENTHTHIHTPLGVRMKCADNFNPEQKCAPGINNLGNNAVHDVNIFLKENS